MNTFKIPPGCRMPLTPEGLRIDYVFNNKEITQTFSILTIDGVRTLQVVTDPGEEGPNPLDKVMPPKSDPV